MILIQNDQKSEMLDAPRFFMYPRSESNRDRQNRNLKFYPLNYRGKRDCKYTNFRNSSKKDWNEVSAYLEPR